MGITFPTLQAVFFTCYPQKLLTIRTKNVPCTFLRLRRSLATSTLYAAVRILSGAFFIY